MRDWALLGAARRAEEIRQELAKIAKAFPASRAGRRVQTGGGGGTLLPDAGAEKGNGRRRRKPMSAAQRKAVGIRMKKYWAARRKASQ